MPKIEPSTLPFLGKRKYSEMSSEVQSAFSSKRKYRLSAEMSDIGTPATDKSGKGFNMNFFNDIFKKADERSDSSDDVIIDIEDDLDARKKR